ncbi:amidohydrolase [bacterium]|nr:amidohydrolase [bacterium]
MRTLYCNGVVYLGGGDWAEAFVVEDGRFGPVGDNTLLESESVDEKINLKGAFVCAGFNDSHMHLLGYGLVLSQADLREHTESLEEMKSFLKAFLKEHPVAPGQWLRGRGFNQDYFKDGARLPSRFDLDEVSRDVPIMLTRVCGHMCVVNSKALELCGVKDHEDGRFYDNEMQLVLDKLPAPTRAELKEMILLACAKLNSCGITSVQTDDYCVFRNVKPSAINEVYRELEKVGKLTLRVTEQFNLTSLLDLQEFLASEEAENNSEFFKIGPLKMLGDGSLGSRTAYLSKPYKGTDDRGLMLFTSGELRDMISYANAKGRQVIVHAIGDACLDAVLDAFEQALKENPRSDHRHGIVHCQVTRADQLERIAALGLHVFAQTVFLDYDNHIVDELLDPELLKTSYNWKTLIGKGVSVSNGSDCPVEDPDCLKGIQLAVTRTSLDETGPYLPEEALSVEEAVDSFTIRSAEASFEEDIKGGIKEGQLADFVILDKNPFVVPADEIHKIKVAATYLGGRKL